MTQDEIIRSPLGREQLVALAREVWPGKVIETEQLMQELERFAALVAAHEREACAKVCEETKAPKIRDEWSAGQTTGCSSCAAAIRVRGEK